MAFNIKENYSSNRYFPSKSRQVTRFLKESLDSVLTLSESQKEDFFSFLSKEFDQLENTEIISEGDFVKIEQNSSLVYFSKPMPDIIYIHILCGYEEWLKRKYSLPGFVEVEEGDVVIDCGGYVGGFSISAQKIARQVHIFEPNVNNFNACLKNFKEKRNVIVSDLGLYNSDGVVKFHVSSNNVEHSILTPDSGAVLSTEEISVITLNSYANKNNIDAIDFLKLEAEGVELEILDGLGNIRPKKIAVDISPEREGCSPKLHFISRLSSLGYQVKVRGNVLFAKLFSEKLAVQEKPFPNVIWSMWYQGEGHAPKLVKKCFEGWRNLNPDYNFYVLDKADVECLLEGFGVDVGGMTLQALSDVVRVALLKRFGGVWVDSTTYPVSSLESWLEKDEHHDFFCFRKEKLLDRKIASWFIASAPGSYIINSWYDEVKRFWSCRRDLELHDNGDFIIPKNPEQSVAKSKSKMYPYFWFHYLFGYLLQVDEEFRKEWAKTVFKYDSAAVSVQKGMVREAVKVEFSPLYKLNWRVEYDSFKVYFDKVANQIEWRG